MSTPTWRAEGALPLRPLTAMEDSIAEPLSGTATAVVLEKVVPVAERPPLTAATVFAASARPAPQPPEQAPGSGRALFLMAVSICAGVSEEFADFTSATRPAMCGVAMLVPW